MNNSWDSFTLEEVIEVASGQVDPTVLPYSDLPHVGGDNIESDTGRLVNVRTARELGLTSGKYIFDEKDVLYSKIRPALNKVVAPEFKGICSADIYPIRPLNGKLCREYLVYLLRSQDFLSYAAKHSSRTNIPKINRKALLAYEALIPPLPEQRRIANILDKADAIRRKREKGIWLTEDLLRSTFLETFGDPETNPKGWKYLPLAEVVSEMEGGKSVLADTEESESTLYRVLKVSAVTWADYRPHESKPVPSEYVPPLAHIVKEGDLLFSRANTTELVGATVYVFDTPPNHLLPDKLWRFVWREDRPMDPQYVRMLFMTSAIKRELGKRATGTSGSMKNISKAKLMAISIPVPPVDLQRKFGKFALAQHKTLTARREGVEATAALFGSLVQRALRGEL